MSIAQITSPVPQPKQDEIQVKLEAVSLNYLHLMVAEGSYYPDLSFPFIAVCDAAGIVEELGDGVTQWKIGDRVTVHYLQRWQAGKATEDMRKALAGVSFDGLLSEYVCFTQKSWIKTQANLSFEEATTLHIGELTAWSGLVELAKNQNRDKR